MLGLLTQPQKELQLDLKTSNTQNCQKMELYGSLTTEDLKKPHSPRQVGEAERKGMKRCADTEWCRCGERWFHIHVWWIKNEEYHRSEGSQTTQPRVPAPGR